MFITTTRIIIPRYVLFYRFSVLRIPCKDCTHAKLKYSVCALSKYLTNSLIVTSVQTGFRITELSTSSQPVLRIAKTVCWKQSHL